MRVRSQRISFHPSYGPRTRLHLGIRTPDLWTFAEVYLVRVCITEEKSSKLKSQVEEEEFNQTKISPKCTGGQEYFLELNGMFLPCCHIGTHAGSMRRLREIYGKNYEMLFVQNNSPEKIIKMWTKIAETWDTENPLTICTKVCKSNRWADITGD